MCDNDGVNSASRSMFTAERLVLKYRRFFRIAVPTIVAADTVRSVLVVAKLAQDRLRVSRRFIALKRRVPTASWRSTQRARLHPLLHPKLTYSCRRLINSQEWDEEQQYELFDNTKDILKRVVVSCHAKERDFWPKAISNAAGVLGRDNFKVDNPLMSTDKAQEESTLFQGGAGAEERCAQRPGPLVIEYVTWGEVWSHASQTIMHTIHCSMSNALFHGGQLSLVKAGSTLCEAADAVGERCRQKFPWPQCTLSRRSALRWSIIFHAVSWPSNFGKARPPLELDLTAY